jgi:hypothetical protein
MAKKRARKAIPVKMSKLSKAPKINAVLQNGT